VEVETERSWIPGLAMLARNDGQLISSFPRRRESRRKREREERQRQRWGGVRRSLSYLTIFSDPSHLPGVRQAGVW
jgi:hypothetical protein